jgi:hypothetical protein
MKIQTRAGLRCHTLRNIITEKGIIPRDTHGTIRYETFVGRRWVFVDWDSGLSTAAPPYELEVRKSEPPQTKPLATVIALHG